MNKVLKIISLGLSVTAVVLSAINVSIWIMKLVFLTKENEDNEE